MGEFFKPWRRKAGCVTLVMATLLTMAWIRSRILFDVLHRNGSESFFAIMSVDSRVAFTRISPRSPVSPYTDWNLGLGYEGSAGFTWDENDNRMAYDPTLDATDIYRRLDLFGFHISEFVEQTGDRYDVCMIPYWSLVIPLTLLSAYLILWPGKRAERQTKPPVQS